jgi:Uma2 family endonuclease
MGIAVRTQESRQELHFVSEDGEIALNSEALQGTWTEEQYLRLTENNNILIEYTDGIIEVLPMPTDKHQSILQFLFLALHTLIHPRGGKVQFAALPIKIREGKHREPDLLAVLDATDPRRQSSEWLGADLVMEVVSPDNPERDTRIKRAEYAEISIPEYWIVNSLNETITVLRLDGDAYIEYGVFRRGGTAISAYRLHN